MDLTQEEIRLLRELSAGPQAISGNKSRDGLKKLVEAGWVTEAPRNPSVTEYALTAAGRSVLTKQVADETIPVEDLNASNDE